MRSRSPVDVTAHDKAQALGFDLCFRHFGNVRGAAGVKSACTVPVAMNQVCSIEFVSDSLANERLLHTFNALDD